MKKEMSKTSLIILLFMATVYLVACSKQISDTAYNKLIINLEEMGLI